MVLPVGAAHHCRVRTACVATIAALVVLSTGGAGAAAPSSFQLVFDGKHNASLLHEGPFSTTSPFCPSGTAADVSVDEATLTALRRFTCSAGGGFTAKVGPLPAEHGGSGSWQIVAGAGPLTDLRGKGTFASVRLSGDPADPSTITFRSTWTGLTDLDATPPTGHVTHWRATKLKHPKRTYRIQLGLSLTDNGGGPISYTLQLVDPRKPSNAIAFKLGTTGTGSLTRKLRIKVAKRTRRVQLKIHASDALGNESAFAKTFRLR
jgi:hypothetical protein